jgi:signal transduction histidine kinase
MWSATGRRRAGAKLAAAYAVLFGLSVIALGAATAFLVDASLRRQIDQRISAEMDDLLKIDADGGTAALVSALAARAGEERGLSYRLETRDRAFIAGALPPAGHGPGWFDFSMEEEDGQREAADSFRGFAAAAAGGNILTVAEDTDEIENTENTLFGVFAAAALCAAALAVAGGLWLSRLYLGKLDAFADTAEAITGGALDRRMPLAEAGDEFDRLSASLNRMLDRNAALLESQRRIASDIAHDIRTPLTRLRQKLEAAKDHDALEDADGLLATLDAVLRIAEIEEGARKANFADVDLAQIARKIEEAYAAPFEEQGKSLSVAGDPSVAARGDPDLLAQLLSNLAENALVHTPAGTSAVIEARNAGGGPILSVRDDGPGVPEAERGPIFRRFHRRDASRATPGNGLGLSLVRAIADLHGADLTASDARPGLKIMLKWPPS